MSDPFVVARSENDKDLYLLPQMVNRHHLYPIRYGRGRHICGAVFRKELCHVFEHSGRLAAVHTHIHFFMAHE